MQTLTIGTETFYRAVGAVNHSRSNDASRPLLTVVQVETVEGTDGYANDLRLVATDSYRMAMADVHYEGEAIEPFNLGGDFKGLLAFLKARVKQTVTLEIEDRNVTVVGLDGGRLVMDNVYGTFPDYRNLLPTELDHGHAAYNPAYLADIGKASMFFAGETPKKATVPVRIDTDASKPGMFKTIASGVGNLIQLLMPVRIPS